MPLILARSVAAASFWIVATKSGYAAFSASTVVIVFVGSAISGSSFSFCGLLIGFVALFIKLPGLCGLFNNCFGNVLNIETSMGTELTTIFEAFSTTVLLSSNINSSQKPFSTAVSPVHHVSSDISCSMSSDFLQVFIAYVFTCHRRNRVSCWPRSRRRADLSISSAAHPCHRTSSRRCACGL